jgi:glycosyltransferase involved in cell wall biosynthesis
MNILFISAILPYPLHSGGQVRLYNLLKRLSTEHTITLYSFIRTDEERDFVSHLSFLKSIHLYKRGYVWQLKYIFRSLTSNLPLLMSSYENKKMKEDIEKDLKTNRYDLIHCEPFYVTPSLPSHLPCPMIITEHNIEYEVYQSYIRQFPLSFLRPIFSIDTNKIRIQEERTWKNAQRIVTVSDGDMTVVRRITGDKKTAVVPNGVDTDSFSFSKKSLHSETLRFLFVGNFLWMPNVKAVETLLSDMWPTLQKHYPEATLRIIGKHLPTALLEKAQKIKVAYDAYVNDIHKEYTKADILLAPMTIAGGTKFKILEAMASGCLVMTTKEGIEGIHATQDTHYLPISDGKSCLTAMDTLIKNKGLYEKIIKNARSLIEQSYDWDVIAKHQSDIWKSTL